MWEPRESRESQRPWCCCCWCCIQSSNMDHAMPLGKKNQLSPRSLLHGRQSAPAMCCWFAAPLPPTDSSASTVLTPMHTNRKTCHYALRNMPIQPRKPGSIWQYKKKNCSWTAPRWAASLETGPESSAWAWLQWNQHYEHERRQWADLRGRRWVQWWQDPAGWHSALPCSRSTARRVWSFMKLCMYSCDLSIELNELLPTSISMDLQLLSFVMKIPELWVCDHIILPGDSIVDHVFGVAQNGVKSSPSTSESLAIYQMQIRAPVCVNVGTYNQNRRT